MNAASSRVSSSAPGLRSMPFPIKSAPNTSPSVVYFDSRGRTQSLSTLSRLQHPFQVGTTRQPPAALSRPCFFKLLKLKILANNGFETNRHTGSMPPCLSTCSGRAFTVRSAPPGRNSPLLKASHSPGSRPNTSNRPASRVRSLMRPVKKSPLPGCSSAGRPARANATHPRRPGVSEGFLSVHLPARAREQVPGRLPAPALPVPRRPRQFTFTAARPPPVQTKGPTCPAGSWRGRSRSNHQRPVSRPGGAC